MSLYEHVLQIVRPYLGEKSEKFLERQCRIHIGMDTDKLTKEHLPALSRWVGISASLMVSTEEADTMRKEIEALGSK